MTSDVKASTVVARNQVVNSTIKGQFTRPTPTRLDSTQLLKAKFYYADFQRNFPARKVAYTSHESRRYKLWKTAT